MIQSTVHPFTHHISSASETTIQQQNQFIQYMLNRKILGEGGKVSSAVFLDAERVFGKVWHGGLMEKLKLCIPVHCALLDPYITSRFFRVKQGNEFSQLKDIEAGIPQGSILGSLLYNLYIMDLPLDSISVTFADD